MSKSSKIIIGIIWLIAFIVGGIGVVQRLVYGHHSAAYGSYVTWGLWVAAYIYFIGLSAGAFLLSSLIYVFGVRKLEKIGKMSLFVALVTLFMALLSIWFDLGHMERFYYVFIRPNFHSMMAWMVWLYTAYFLLLLVEMWFVMRADLAKWSGLKGLRGVLGRVLIFGKTELSPESMNRDRKYLKVLGSIGVPLAVAFHGGVGALFGTVVARPYWHTPIYPILFLTGALVSGGALMTAAVAFFWPLKDQEWKNIVVSLGKVVLMLLFFDLILEWAEFSIPMWYGVGPEYELMRKVLFGKFWWVFWIVHFLLGSVIPIFLLVKWPKEPVKIGIAGSLIAITFMAARLNIVIPGLIEPQLKGLEKAFIDPRLRFEYMPSLFEWQVVLFIVALGFALFYIGYRLLPITETKEA
jgi:molybdopterin-containing oxidoreductase family membrane subunit